MGLGFVESEMAERHRCRLLRLVQAFKAGTWFYTFTFLFDPAAEAEGQFADVSHGHSSS